MDVGDDMMVMSSSYLISCFMLSFIQLQQTLFQRRFLLLNLRCLRFCSEFARNVLFSHSFDSSFSSENPCHYNIVPGYG